MANYRIKTKGNAVRQARIERGLDLGELARKAGISRSMVSMIENGAGTSPQTAHSIAEVLSKSVPDLFEVVEVARQTTNRN
jgi:transcriptional regulator with XRE-family HTH domain